MSIGDLNKRLTLQHQIKTSDGMGGWVSVWTDAAHKTRISGAVQVI